MKKPNTQKGFTLVELAIVMTIIGLLIGGILKGQELMQNARATATIARVRAFESAVTTFRDTYSSVPGDMVGAGTRLAGCPGTNGANCNPGTTGAGNNIVGSLTWATTAPAWNTQYVNALPAAAAAVGAETTLFWSHLLLADLITGVSSETLNGNVAAAWNVTHPSAPIGGGFLAGYGSGGAAIQPGAFAATTAPNGMLLVLALQPAAALALTSGTQPMTATRAALIDRKMDDGRPQTGSVQGYGVQLSCFGGGNPPAANALAATYNEATTANDCGLMFRIQG